MLHCKDLDLKDAFIWTKHYHRCQHCDQNQKHMRTAASGQTRVWANLPKAGKSADRLGLGSSVPAERTTPELHETKASTRQPSQWVAGLLYGDLLCPLVTIKDKPGNLVPSIPINKIRVQLHLLAWRQAMGLFWLCLAQLRIFLSWGSLSLLPCRMEQGKKMLFWKVENRHPKLGNECPRDW